MEDALDALTYAYATLVVSASAHPLLTLLPPTSRPPLTSIVLQGQHVSVVTRSGRTLTGVVRVVDTSSGDIALDYAELVRG